MASRNSSRQWLSHIADTAPDEARGAIGIRIGESFDATVDLGKKVAGFEFEVV
jgi:hypothetical protein